MKNTILARAWVLAAWVLTALVVALLWVIPAQTTADVIAFDVRAHASQLSYYDITVRAEDVFEPTSWSLLLLALLLGDLVRRLIRRKARK